MSRTIPLPVQLHVIHDLGGGSATWLKDFCMADTRRINLILKSFTQSNAMGCGVSLYAHVSDEMPLRMWHFSEAIQATVVTHAEYLCVLDEIIKEYGVSALLVSSVIGHSLDVLNTGLPTAVVNHDYFPYCPAINIHFGEVCRRCDPERIGQCYLNNPKFNPFVTFLPHERAAVREQFLALIARANVTMIAPSRSVQENLARLDARFRGVSFVTIPHGYGRELKMGDVQRPPANERLRILVLGQLSVPKGLELLRGSLDALLQFAEIYLVGCRELGEFFKFKAGVHIFPDYDINELPGHVATINPHVGLLMSIVPETFSYALTELMMLGVPVAATRVGSFPERIQHGQDGFLYEPNVASLLAAMRAINDDRQSLESIRRNLRGWTPRTAEAMVADYYLALPIGMPITAQIEAKTVGIQSLEKIMPNQQLNQQPNNDANRDEIRLTQSLTISSMWKELKSLNLRLSMINQARQELSNQLERERKTTQQLRDQVCEAARQASEAARQASEVAREASEQQTALSQSRAQIHILDAHIDEFLHSTSWQLTLPVRALGHLLRKLNILGRSFVQLIRDPKALPANVTKLFRVWRSGGLLGLKVALVGVQNSPSMPGAWETYRETFSELVKPQIVRCIHEMTSTPLISIIVPTYNTPEAMLREMLDSVKAQLYPHWELCIADDGSDEPQVKQILMEYATTDRRIKLQFGPENRGVSYASNRALEMVTSEFVVLLDHDDLLEEHSLFRFVESFLQDKPDMVYSDEVLVTPDALSVTQYVYRPAFSPEFLRSHPYIVHLVGFKTQLLRDIGGFDEKLNISQDYDLILRAVERSQTIAHIPEILYQWRIHANSAGHLQMHEVMEVSKGILQRHLERCGEKGRAQDGAGFNFFDTRYPLDDDLVVAIIVPTKNHGALLQQCIQSIRATVLGVKYDIVVIDHESDDADTLTYLSSISPGVRVLRYEGVFNFSAINNWAVSKLDGKYSHYLFCNNDIEAISPGWLERMLELGQCPSVGIVGAKLFYPDRKTIQHAGVCVGAFGRAEHYGKFMRLPADRLEPGYFGGLVINHEVSAVTGACLLMGKSIFEQISGFDENIAVGFGDIDLCLRAGKLGYRVLFCPYAELVHHESYTRGTSAGDAHEDDTALFKAKWQKMLKMGDPYFNPGLSKTSTSWQYANPVPCHFEIKRRVFERDSVSGLQKMSI